MSQITEPQDYASRRNPKLPWGHWLMVDDHGSDRIIDEEGRHWSSVRDCLWRSRLGMPKLDRDVQDEGLEFLLTVLAVIDRRLLGIEEFTHALFNDSMVVAAHYAQWLIGQGLVEHNSCGRPDGPLTCEGYAVLVMLASTRSPEHAPIPIGLNWINNRRGLDHGKPHKGLKELLSKQEALADQLQYRFVRRDIFDTPGIALVGEGLGPTIPLRRTIWSLSFPDNHARDRFYLWLHERLDRWLDWGEMAQAKSGRVLSEHLLQLAFADRPIKIA